MWPESGLKIDKVGKVGKRKPVFCGKALLTGPALWAMSLPGHLGLIADNSSQAVLSPPTFTAFHCLSPHHVLSFLSAASAMWKFHGSWGIAPPKKHVAHFAGLSKGLAPRTCPPPPPLTGQMTKPRTLRVREHNGELLSPGPQIP